MSWTCLGLHQFAILILCFALVPVAQAEALESFSGSSTTFISSSAIEQEDSGDYNFTAHKSQKGNSVVHVKYSRHSALCPSNVECWKLGGECIKCFYNKLCVYGENVTVDCAVNHKDIHCNGSRTFNRTYICRYCYQTESWEHVCTKNSNCRVVSNPRERYVANCTVKSEVLCMGNRSFPKYMMCNLTAGYKWTTALVLSVFVGGFGADRFYLGHWQEGIGKLFSFGGLGVWTILDVILISTGYLGPADGSLYMW